MGFQLREQRRRVRSSRFARSGNHHGDRIPRWPLYALLAFIGVLLFAGLGCRGDHRPAGAPSPIASTSAGRPRFVNPDTGQSLPTAVTDLDFGRVRLRDSARRELRIRNDGPATSTVTAVQSAPDDFPREAFFLSSVPFDIGPGGEATFAITFQPTQARDVSGSLALLVANGDPSTLLVRVRGTGFRDDSPDLEVDPQPLELLDFGDSPGALHVSLANVGTDVPGTTADNLRFGVLGPGGEWLARTPEITGPDASAFSLNWPPSGYGPDGLSEGQSIDLRVDFLPSCQGLKSATLVIASNDPDLPEVRVPMVGFGVASRLCEVEAIPSPLDFGVVDPGRSVTLGITIASAGRPGAPRAQQIALLDLSPDTKAAGAFILPTGPIVNASIPEGGSLFFPVVFSPPDVGPYAGEIVVRTAGPSISEGTLSLSGSGASTCLYIAPRELDFGHFGLDCNSRQRLFTMYNTCASNVSVAAIDVLKGPSADRFTITKTPHLPFTIAGGSQADFGVTFHPMEEGDERANVSLQLDGVRGPVLVWLVGHGATTPIQTDVFGGIPQSKYDILFVVDNSPSMARFQSALTANFTSFIRSARREQCDLTTSTSP